MPGAPEEPLLGASAVSAVDPDPLLGVSAPLPFPLPFVGFGSSPGTAPPDGLVGLGVGADVLVLLHDFADFFDELQLGAVLGSKEGAELTEGFIDGLSEGCNDGATDTLGTNDGTAETLGDVDGISDGFIDREGEVEGTVEGS